MLSFAAPLTIADDYMKGYESIYDKLSERVAPGVQHCDGPPIRYDAFKSVHMVNLANANWWVGSLQSPLKTKKEPLRACIYKTNPVYAFCQKSR